MTSTEEHEWLPMPSGLSITQHSFADEILQQFNIESEISAINTQENESNEAHNSVMSQSTKSSSIHNYNHSHKNHNNRAETASTSAEKRIQITTPSRRRSAGDLLRKSSVYLRNRYVAMRSTTEEPQNQEQIIKQQQQQRTSRFHTWTLNNKNKSKAKRRDSSSNYNYYSEKRRDSLRESNNNTLTDISTSNNNSNITDSNNDNDNSNNNNNNNNDTSVSKVAIHTTIKLSSPSSHQQLQQQYHNNNNHIHPRNQQHPNFTTSVNPPVITQYPPRPLKYSPVEPLSEMDDDHAGTPKPKHHFSLLRLSNEQQQTERRPSDSQDPHDGRHIMLHGIGRHWNKLLFSCGIKKK